MGAFDRAWAFLKSDADDYYTGFNKVGDRIHPDGTFIPDYEMTDEEHMQMVRDHMALPMEERRLAETPRFSIDYNRATIQQPIGGSADDHDAYLHDLIERDILSEIEKEGGALGMKNLKDIADEQNLNEVLSQMEAAGKIFRHEDGDIYTHEPEGN